MNVQVTALVFPEETKRSFSRNPLNAEEWCELSGLEAILLPILSTGERGFSFMCTEVMT